MPKLSRILAVAAVVSSLAIPSALSAQVVSHKVPVKKPVIHSVKKTTPVKVTPKKVTTKKVTPPVKKPKAVTMPKNGVNGTASAINGTSITLTNASGTVYLIDASQAKLMQGMGSSGLSLSNVQVGDKLMIMGTMSGTTVIAKSINDQSFEGRNIFSGSVTVINGSTLSVTGRNKAAYSIDASSAVIITGMATGTTSNISAVKVGDQVTAVGTLNGTSVTATAIRDMGKFQRGGMLGQWGNRKNPNIK